MKRRACMLATICVMTIAALPANAAQGQGSIEGTVLDLLGARVAGAAVTLIRDGQASGETTSQSDGTYAFRQLDAGRVQVTVTAPGFETRVSEPHYLGAGSRLTLDVTLQLGALEQAVVVTAAAGAVSQSRTGAPVTVVDREVLGALHVPDLAEALRLVPGAQVHQTGARGGATALFLRGGNSNFAKVLVDGVAINDIGGAFDFSQLATTGIERVEVLRQSNSVLYGADALSGVISIETKRGRARVPEVTYAIDGGNLGTFHHTLSLGGVVRRFDYFSEYSHDATDNRVPNNAYRNTTYAGRFGAQLAGGTAASGVIRHVDGRYGSANAITLYGIPDDSSQRTRLTSGTLAVESQWSDRFQTALRAGSVGQRADYVNPTPSGEAVDPFGFGANYLGNTVTVSGANGYRVTGRAILDYGGFYPLQFSSRTTRRSAEGRAGYRVAGDIDISAGVRLEREQSYRDPDGDATTTRDNHGLFVEGRGSLGARTSVTAGLGVEYNAAFGRATTPRVSVATYLRTPVAGVVGDTKLSLNAGKGIKAPAVYQVESSLFALLRGSASAAAIGPIGPERGTSVDVGLEQGFLDGQARVRVAWFRNRYTDLIEYVNRTVLPQLGVAAAVVQDTPFGAYVNAASYDASGVEVSLEAAVARRLRLMASYTYLDATVTRSFGSDALSPAVNPAFPGVQIGAFSPLVGSRPFRRPAHSGSVLVSYTAGRAQVALMSSFTGTRDDSTFLTDEFFGNSMLLPNEGLDPAYQKVDVSAAYATSRVRPYMSIENLLNARYEAAFGYPSLPRTVRAGVALTIGGD